MKNSLIILAIGITFSIHSQDINFQDPILKSRLLSASPFEITAGVFDGTSYVATSIDTNNDGEIQISEAQTINSLNISNYIGQNPMITDITGLEFFSNLHILNLNRINLHNFSLSPYPSIMVFEADSSNLDSIDIGSASMLEWFFIPNNNLTALNFTTNPRLKSVDCVNNHLTSLDFHTNPDFFDLGCRFNNISYINVENGHFQSPGQGAWHGDDWSGNPLQTICADAFEIASINSVLQFWQSTATVNSCTLSTIDNSISNLKIYPNPATNTVAIRSNVSIQSITFFDVAGREVYQWNGNEKQTFIDISHLVSGVYIVTIKSVANAEVIKLIKK